MINRILYFRYARNDNTAHRVYNSDRRCHLCACETGSCMIFTDEQSETFVDRMLQLFVRLVLLLHRLFDHAWRPYHICAQNPHTLWVQYSAKFVECRRVSVWSEAWQKLKGDFGASFSITWLERNEVTVFWLLTQRMNVFVLYISMFQHEIVATTRHTNAARLTFVVPWW